MRAMSRRLCRGTVHLLAVLWVVTRCGAHQPQPAPAADQSGHSPDVLDQLLMLIGRAVKEAADPIIAELNSQRDLLSDIVIKLNSQDSQVNSLNSLLNIRLDSVTSRLDAFSSQFDSRLDSLNSGMDSRLESLNSRLDSRLDSRMESLNSGLDSRLESLNSGVDSRLESLNSGVDSRLDSLNSGLDSKMDSVNVRLDGLSAGLDSLNSGLDSRLESLNSGVDSRLDSLNSGLDSKLDSVNARLDGLSAGLDARLECAQPEPNSLPRDCSDLAAGTPSGMYVVRPGLGRSDPVEAFCDMGTDGGNWTVFQRRADILPRQNFYRNWTEYRDGFGELHAEFWWGLQKLWLMTSPLDRRYELRVDLEDFSGERRHAVYQDFRISSESDGFRLTGGNYTGDAGDSLTYHFDRLFSTKDKDQDGSDGDCAQDRKGAWWYKDCHHANLNGEYLSGKTADDVYGVTWKAWKGYHYSLKSIEMKIRPTTKSA